MVPLNGTGRTGSLVREVKPRDDTTPLTMDFHRFVLQEERRVLQEPSKQF